MSKTLLVYPDIKSLMPRFPTSVLALAAYLKSKDEEVTIIDDQIDDYKNVHLGDYDFVGISSMTGYQIKKGLEIARFIRAKDNDIPIIWGGVHPTLDPHSTIENDNVDIVVRGEGELTLNEIVKKVKGRDDVKNLKQIKGITFKAKDRIIDTN